MSQTIPVPIEFSSMREFPIDGGLLLFDRDTGLNVLYEGDETAHLRQRAPRMVQFGLTNHCNLACNFCSRDLSAGSQWSFSDVLLFLTDLCEYGLLEVAFGGGEPLLFPGFEELVCQLYARTRLAINFTTNGLLLTTEKLLKMKGRYGQLRLSLYEDNQWREKVTMLAKANARFGVNYLLTPSRFADMEVIVLELAQLGCRDVLLLSYNGYDSDMHLSDDQSKDLANRVSALAKALRNRCRIKLGVCWGEQLDIVPRLFQKSDCGAGMDFLVITSDRKLQPCSFHQLAIPIATAHDVMHIWSQKQAEMAKPADLPGCARQTLFTKQG